MGAFKDLSGKLIYDPRAPRTRFSILEKPGIKPTIAYVIHAVDTATGSDKNYICRTHCALSIQIDLAEYNDLNKRRSYGLSQFWPDVTCKMCRECGGL